MLSLQEAALVALCQVNVALGVFYVGLREARYRNKLYAEIVTIFNARLGALGMDGRVSRFPDFCFMDSKFAKMHHFVMEWIRELPEDFKEKLTEISKWQTPSGQARISESSDLWSRVKHIWFKTHGDKWVIWLLTITPALTIIWCFLIRPSLISMILANFWGVMIISFVVFLGEAMLVFCVWSGRQMRRKIANKLEGAIGYIVAQVDKDKIPDLGDRNAPR
jgi:hypothetical protein